MSEAVIRLFEDGLIYHENSLVNWCPHLQSTISDIEIDYHVLENPTLMNVPGYAQPVEFGLIYDFAMKIIGPSGDFGGFTKVSFFKDNFLLFFGIFEFPFFNLF